jgi:hypothetical protein
MRSGDAMGRASVLGEGGRGGVGGRNNLPCAWELALVGAMIHGWAKISGIYDAPSETCRWKDERKKHTVILFVTSTTSILLIKSLARGSTREGISYFPLLTLDSKARTFLSSKGNRPVSRAYRMTPQLQISVALPWYFSPLTISGLA